MSHSFGKAYKLVSKNKIEEVHQHGSTIKLFPFVCKSLAVENQHEALQFAIAVPKRIHKKAYVRNLIKRRIREGIRRNKTELEASLQKQSKCLAIFVIYTSPEILDYKLIEKKIKQLFTKVELQ